MHARPGKWSKGMCCCKVASNDFTFIWPTLSFGPWTSPATVDFGVFCAPAVCFRVYLQWRRAPQPFQAGFHLYPASHTNSLGLFDCGVPETHSLYLIRHACLTFPCNQDC